MFYQHSLRVYNDETLAPTYMDKETVEKVTRYLYDNEIIGNVPACISCYPLCGKLAVDTPFYATPSLSFDTGDDVEFSLENDIREASYDFPTIIFELTIRCCDTNEYTRYYFRNGSIKRSPGEVLVSYPPFDSIEWAKPEKPHKTKSLALTPWQERICKDFGWKLSREGASVMELEKYTPANECYTFCTRIAHFAHDVRYEADHFDPDVHAASFLDVRGQDGVPDTLQELLDDANFIKKELLKLSEKLDQVKE